MIFKYRGKLRIAPYEYGKDPYGARYKGLILKDRLIAVSDTFFRIKNEQKKQTINEMLSKYDEASRARIAELLVDSAIGSNKASGIPKPLESQRKQMIEEQKKSLNEPTEKSVEVEIIDGKTFKLRKKIMGLHPDGLKHCRSFWITNEFLRKIMFAKEYHDVFKFHSEPLDVIIVHMEDHPFLPGVHIAILHSQSYPALDGNVIPMIVPIWSDEPGVKTLESYHLNYDPEQNEKAKDL